MKNYQRLVFLGVLAFVLSGCASSVVESPSNTESKDSLWINQKLKNQEIKDWELKGKIGVKTGRKGGSATLNWSYSKPKQNIELYGPFGGGRILISVTDDKAILKDTKGKVIEGESAQDVLYQKLRWHIPFEELIMWSRGLPNPGATEIDIDDMGRLKSLNQGIWHVEYQEYRQVDEYLLPRKFVITSLPGNLELYDRKGNYLGDELNVKVILKKWRGFNQE